MGGVRGAGRSRNSYEHGKESHGGIKYDNIRGGRLCVCDTEAWRDRI